MKFPEWQQAFQGWRSTQRARKNPGMTQVNDVSHVGADVPFFSKFRYEDWALLRLRFELNLLLQLALDEPGTLGLPTMSLQNLQKKCHQVSQKHFNVSAYGFHDFSDLAELIKDTIKFNVVTGMVESQLSHSTVIATFLKLTEAGRKQRTEGDALKFRAGFVL